MHASEDKKRRELVDARNEADSVCYQAERQLAEMGEKVSAADKEPITKQIAAVREAAKGENIDAIKNSLRDLQNAIGAMAMHRGGAGPEPAGAGAHAEGGAPKDDDTIDVEFKEKK
jgi:molecular chaperone DnaK